MSKGMVHIYTGDGKGKTTSAVGLAARCAGHGKKVIFYQFLKVTPTGELDSLKKLGVNVIRVNSCEKFYFNMNDEEKYITKCETELTLKTLFTNTCAMLILDEILCAVDNGIINTDKIIEIIKNKPSDTELILTGRNMPAGLLEYADYVSEIKCMNHPYDKGIDARQGIDF